MVLKRKLCVCTVCTGLVFAFFIVCDFYGITLLGRREEQKPPLPFVSDSVVADHVESLEIPQPKADLSNTKLPPKDSSSASESWWADIYPNAWNRTQERAWTDHTWWSNAFIPSMRRLLYNASIGRQNITIATLGGSASSYVPPMYMHHFADELKDFLNKSRQKHKLNNAIAEVHTLNPSAGNTGSEWAAMLMESLIPKNVDILFWEFTINDWMLEGAKGISQSQRRKQIFELFVHRAVALNPNIIIGIVSLWPPGCAMYWPMKSVGSAGYFDVMSVASCYNQEAIFSIDMRAHFWARHYRPRVIFRDGHHPNANGYKEIGFSLYTHVVNAVSPAQHDMRPEHSCMSAEADKSLEQKRSGQLPSFAFSNEAAKSLIISRLLGTDPFASTIYDVARFHGSTANVVQQITSHQAFSSGKAYEHRIDRKKNMPIPHCSFGHPLMYRVSHRAPDMHLIGLNVRKPDGSLLSKLPSNWKDISVSIISPTRIQLEDIALETMRTELHAAALTRGLCAPQAWFTIGKRQGVPYPLEVSICAKGRNGTQGSLGSIVFM